MNWENGFIEYGWNSNFRNSSKRTKKKVVVELKVERNRLDAAATYVEMGMKPNFARASTINYYFIGSLENIIAKHILDNWKIGATWYHRVGLQEPLYHFYIPFYPPHPFSRINNNNNKQQQQIPPPRMPCSPRGSSSAPPSPCPCARPASWSARDYWLWTRQESFWLSSHTQKRSSKLSCCLDARSDWHTRQSRVLRWCQMKEYTRVVSEFSFASLKKSLKCPPKWTKHTPASRWLQMDGQSR